MGAKGSSVACMKAAKKSHFISIHTARESAIIGKRRGFNKKFESGLRDFADDRPGLEDKRESGWKRVPPTAASRFERKRGKDVFLRVRNIE